jgi:2-polyprenyl-6-methoxyphenol hydroxylase-like FAD-dependent oxidoreductase
MTMACELARYGVPLRIVDKAAERTDKSKALGVWSRTLELLDRGGGAAPFIDAGFKATAVNFISRDKLIGRVSVASVQSPYPFALALPQSETERLLEERMAGLGIATERQVELASFESHDGGVEAVLRHPDGREETVRHVLAVPFAGETMSSDWMLADVHMTGYPYPADEASVFWHRDGVFVIFPISVGRFRVLADLPPSGAERPPTPTLEEVQAIIDRRGPGGLRAFDPIWLAGFRINGRKVASYRWGRAFLAGDAAHVHSPAGAQGMNTGMQDAFNLAWKLALVIRGVCAESLLDSYSPERSGVGDEVLKTAGRLTTIGTLRNPSAQNVRNLVGQVMLGLKPMQHKLADTMAEVTIGYPHGPLNGPSLGGAGPKAGERVVPVAGQTPVGSGSTPLFALFAEKSAATTDLVKQFPRLLEPQVRPPLEPNGIWLVRPDGYVASSTSDPSVIANYLDKLIGENTA